MSVILPALEMEARAWNTQGHSWPYNKFKGSLDYIRFYLNEWMNAGRKEIMNEWMGYVICRKTEATKDNNKQSKSVSERQIFVYFLSCVIPRSYKMHKIVYVYDWE